jgi:hypothetical protein
MADVLLLAAVLAVPVTIILVALTLIGSSIAILAEQDLLVGRAR